MDKKWVIFRPEGEDTLEWEANEKDKSLTDAVILCPEGEELWDEAIDTLRRLRNYRSGTGAIALFGDSVGVILDPQPLNKLLAEAERRRSRALDSDPDYAPCYAMIDGGALVVITGEVFGLHPNFESLLDSGLHRAALDIRRDIAAVCAEEELFAVIYNNADDYQKYNP